MHMKVQFFVVALAFIHATDVFAGTGPHAPHIAPPILRPHPVPPHVDSPCPVSSEHHETCSHALVGWIFSAALGVDQALRDQFANQIEQIARDRKNNVAINIQFENALRDDHYLFLVSENLSKDYDNGKGSRCSLHGGDVLQRKTTMGDNGAVSLGVRASQSGSCSIGSDILMQANDLANIYSSFQVLMDIGAKQLADHNQPG